MTPTTSKVLSLRVESELFARLHEHAARRGMSVQDYVVRTLVREDFDERFQASVDATERFYGPAGPGDRAAASGATARDGAPSRDGAHAPDPDGPRGQAARADPAGTGSGAGPPAPAEPGGRHRLTSRPAPARSGRA